MASLSEPDTGVTAGAATQMTDAEMDTVTAGAASLEEMWPTYVRGSGQSWHRNASNGYNQSGHRGAHFLTY